MTEPMHPDWPVADFDPVRRLRVLAATVPGASLHEAVLAEPFERVWEVAADLEGALPRWLPDIRTVRANADATEALIVGHSRLRARFDVRLEPGWCLMQSRFVLGGMAARPDGEGTRFAFLGTLRLPAAGLLAPALRPLGVRSLRRFEALVGERR
ncbi:hypothetical protein ACGFX4_25210 [Kitasatospora sp. NPDC048365]|uniref:hypothetical protein n=1 Tax=Kitasatospora sp. NPDC048365 TaxID=3364050 RepID=UPI0037177D80